ncbi:hypothetical protein [Actinocorallia longicatena]|uniref:DUF222 domain-containing protein n=1 Tax=Actinocorallia longicatena TaxID=111803 RepID=A0ABP6QFN3_9ACTN
MTAPAEPAPAVAEDMLRDVRDAVTPQRAAELLARWLGTDLPVSEQALVAALVHPGYQRRLSAARCHRDAVAWLLDRPPELPPSAAHMAGLERDVPQHSTAQLLKRASVAMTRWSASGFTAVDEATRARRWAACEACPHLVDVEPTGLYRLSAALRAPSQVCSACGCTAAAKVRLPSESCPVADPADPERTRWGDLLHRPEPEGRVRSEKRSS